MWLILVFVAIPLVEVLLFLTIGSAIGILSTFAIIIVTALIGGFLLRRQGFLVLHSISTSLEGGTTVARSLVHGLLVFVAALLLLTPGFFTDAFGLAMLFHRPREFIIAVGGRVILDQIRRSRRSAAGSRSKDWSDDDIIVIDADD